MTNAGRFMSENLPQNIEAHKLQASFFDGGAGPAAPSLLIIGWPNHQLSKAVNHYVAKKHLLPICYLRAFRS